MFLTQVYGTVLGAFVNYAVMISIVGGNRDHLVNSNGDASWSGATIQGYNTNATSWAMAKYLYKSGARYSIVPIGLAIGAGAVVVHRFVVHVSTPCLLPLQYPTSSTFRADSGCL
jgi:urea transporter